MNAFICIASSTSSGGVTPITSLNWVTGSSNVGSGPCRGSCLSLQLHLPRLVSNNPQRSIHAKPPSVSEVRPTGGPNDATNSRMLCHPKSLRRIPGHDRQQFGHSADVVNVAMTGSRPLDAAHLQSVGSTITRLPGLALKYFKYHRSRNPAPVILFSSARVQPEDTDRRLHGTWRPSPPSPLSALRRECHD